MAYTTTQKIVAVVSDLKGKVMASLMGKELPEVEQQKFVLLLSAVSSCRKWPTLSEPMGFDCLYKCKSLEERKKTAEWLQNNYDVVDWVSLESACRNYFNIHEEYRRFWADWYGFESFLQESKPDPAQLFKLNRCNAYAENFADILGESGFYAYDCNERIGLCRVAYACGIITEEEFWYAVTPYAKKASLIYDNWAEYGISYLLGFCYHTYQQRNCSEEITMQFKTCYGIINYLYDNNWSNVGWYTYSTEYAIDKSNMKQLINWEGPDLCIATNRITVDGFPIGFMSREIPDPNFEDSGWRFYQGHEDDEYAYNLSNSGMHSLNDICNYDPAIIPYLDMPVGTCLVRKQDGTFEPYESDENMF